MGLDTFLTRSNRNTAHSKISQSPFPQAALTADGLCLQRAGPLQQVHFQLLHRRCSVTSTWTLWKGLIPEALPSRLCPLIFLFTFQQVTHSPGACLAIVLTPMQWLLLNMSSNVPYDIPSCRVRIQSLETPQPLRSRGQVTNQEFCCPPGELSSGPLLPHWLGSHALFVQHQKDNSSCSVILTSV